MQNIESVIMVSFSVIYLHTGYLYLSILQHESLIKRILKTKSNKRKLWLKKF